MFEDNQYDYIYGVGLQINGKIEYYDHIPITIEHEIVASNITHTIATDHEAWQANELH